MALLTLLLINAPVTVLTDRSLSPLMAKATYLDRIYKFPLRLCLVVLIWLYGLVGDLGYFPPSARRSQCVLVE